MQQGPPGPQHQGSAHSINAGSPERCFTGIAANKALGIAGTTTFESLQHSRVDGTTGVPDSLHYQQHCGVVELSFRDRATVFLYVGIAGGERVLGSPIRHHIFYGYWDIVPGVAGHIHLV